MAAEQKDSGSHLAGGASSSTTTNKIKYGFYVSSTVSGWFPLDSFRAYPIGRAVPRIGTADFTEFANGLVGEGARLIGRGFVVEEPFTKESLADFFDKRGYSQDDIFKALPNLRVKDAYGRLVEFHPLSSYETSVGGGGIGSVEDGEGNFILQHPEDDDLRERLMAMSWPSPSVSLSYSADISDSDGTLEDFGALPPPLLSSTSSPDELPPELLSSSDSPESASHASANTQFRRMNYPYKKEDRRLTGLSLLDTAYWAYRHFGEVPSSAEALRKYIAEYVELLKRGEAALAWQLDFDY